MTAFVLNTNALDLIGLKMHDNGEFINDAVCTFVIKDKAGVEVAGTTWPQVMSYIAGSDGNYQGILPYNLEMTGGKMYTAIIDAQGGGERVGHWEMPFKPLVRTGLPEGVTSA